VSEGTCQWPDCDQPIHGRNLCKRHNQRARRAGIIEQFWRPGLCQECGAQLSGCRANKVYCSQRCINVAYWKSSDKQERARRNLEWYHSVAPARRQTALGQRPARFCEECGKELPRAATARKRFCDRHCINQTRMREKAHQAREHSRRRKRRLIGPGVSEADWLALVRRFDGKCAYCEVRAPLTQDHVVPVSRGGQHAIGNVVPACRSCNAKKKHRLLVEWRLSKTVSRKRLAA
jgi:5-methylcytosine-specific restriction endonuclease McrA